MRDSAPSDTQKKRVIVGMSGGVDSSVSAVLLMEQGYEVEGLFMKNWEEDDNEEYCSAATDLADAHAVCDKLGIELDTVNFADFWLFQFTHREQALRHLLMAQGIKEITLVFIGINAAQ